jgi:hypothetical protein
MTRTNVQQQLGRAKNALLSFLEHRLYIPKIYLDAEWDGHHLDVLAIDRDGSGDVHAVLLFAMEHSSGLQRELEDRLESETALVAAFAGVQAHYKYIACALLDAEAGEFSGSRSYHAVGDLLAPDGIGRIGFITVEQFDKPEPKVTLDVRPERFRAKVAKLADNYIVSHEADWQIREIPFSGDDAKQDSLV